MTNDRFNDNLRVFIRCRPVLPTESTSVTDTSTYSIVRILDNKLVVVLDPEKVYREQMNGKEYAGNDDPDAVIKPLSKHFHNDVLRVNRSREKQYAFDIVFDGNDTQQNVFEKCVEPLLDSVLDGFNATCFAYGQTGSGKTYTMLGPEDSPGIMFRALQGIFDRIAHSTSNSSDYEYKIILSYLEIYNENIRDLIQPSDEYLELREDNDRMHVVGLTEITVKSVKETMQILRKGNQNRIQEETSHNKESSRSHAVLQINVEKRSRLPDVNEEVQVGKLSLIDLAGSERAAESNNRGIRLREGANINRSLLALGNCINALGQRNNKGGYIPYRDSKLTRLLKDSLGGNCRTSMISCISPTNYEDTINTLKYANRAKNIRMTVTRNITNVNHHIVHYTNIINELKGEITNLKQKLIVTNKQLNFQKKQVSQANLKRINTYSELDLEFDSLTQEVVANFEEMMQARKSVIELEALELANKLQISKLQHELSNTKESILKSPASKRTQLIQSVSKRRREIEDLIQNMGRNARMKSEFQEKYEQLELLAITLKEKLKLATSDNRQKQEMLTQLFRLHLLELQNTELQSFQSKQEDLIKDKDITIENLKMQLLVRDAMINSQYELLTRYQKYEIEYPPSYIPYSEFTHDIYNEVLEDNQYSEPSSSRTLPPISVPMEDGIIYPISDLELLEDVDTTSDLVGDLSNRNSNERTNSRITERSSTPSPKRRSEMIRKNSFSTPPPQRRYSVLTPNPQTNNSNSTNSKIINPKSNGKSAKKISKKSQYKHRLLSKIYGYTPLNKKSPNRKKKEELISKDLDSNNVQANKNDLDQIQPIEDLVETEEIVMKDPESITSMDPIENKEQEVEELFIKKTIGKQEIPSDNRIFEPSAILKLEVSDNESSRMSLQQARLLRKQRLKENKPNKDVSMSLHDDVVPPERSESPEQTIRQFKNLGEGSRVSSSVDMEFQKDSKFPSLYSRRRLQSIPVSQSYEENFMKKMMYLERQRQLLHKTP